MRLVGEWILWLVGVVWGKSISCDQLNYVTHNWIHCSLRTHLWATSGPPQLVVCINFYIRVFIYLFEVYDVVIFLTVWYRMVYNY
jgi:hypothetical protein